MSATDSVLDQEEYSVSGPGGPSRLLVTHEGLLDPACLVRTEGYMYKKGGTINSRGGFRNWKKRWFELTPVDFFDTQGYELRYYDAPGGTLKGSVALNDVDLRTESKSTHKLVKYELQLILQHGAVLELSCDDEEERDEWIDTLQIVITFLGKVTTAAAMTLDGYDPLAEDDEHSYNIGEEIANNSRAIGPGLYGSEAGKTGQFVVRLHDLAGQEVLKGGMPITASISGGGCLYHLAIFDNNRGSYYAHYTLGRCGKYDLSVKLNDEHHIFGSPFQIEVLPSKTLPKFCYADGEALQRIPVKATSTFIIQAMDGYGNKKSRGGDPFEVGIMGNAQLVDLKDNNDGTYLCSVEVNAPQSNAYGVNPSLMIIITLYGKHIKGSPFKPMVVDKAGPGGATNRPGGSMRGISGNNSVASASFADPNMLIPPPKVRSNNSISASSGPQLQSPLPNQQVINQMQIQRSMAPQSRIDAAASQGQSITGRVNPQQAIEDNGAAPMSRLERSRQRALLAKTLAEQGGNTAPSIPTSAQSNPSPQQADRRLPANTQQVQSSSLLQMSNLSLEGQSVGMAGGIGSPGSAGAAAAAGARTSKLSQLAQRSAATLQAMKAIHGEHAAAVSSNPQQRTPAQLELAAGLRIGLGKGFTLQATASSLEISIAEQSQKALVNENVIERFCVNSDVLNQLFSFFADRVEGVAVIKLDTSRGNGGVFRMLEMYEITPVLCSKAEAKAIFNLMILGQRFAKAPAAFAGGGSGLDFPFFLKYLLGIALCALSRANSFSDVFSAVETKLDVLLYKWGFADANKLHALRRVMTNTSI